jgi:hypothetical protein
MPRKPTIKDLDVDAAIDRIKQHCVGTATSLNALSRVAGVSQPALYRFVHGDRKTITPTARRVLAHINGQHNWHNQHSGEDHADGYQIIGDAVNSVWDGRIQTAELLAALIRAIKPVLLAAEAVGNTLPHERV